MDIRQNTAGQFLIALMAQPSQSIPHEVSLQRCVAVNEFSFLILFCFFECIQRNHETAQVGDGSAIGLVVVALAFLLLDHIPLVVQIFLGDSSEQPAVPVRHHVGRALAGGQLGEEVVADLGAEGLGLVPGGAKLADGTQLRSIGHVVTLRRAPDDVARRRRRVAARTRPGPVRSGA